jgi:putative hydrolase of the HAD superfamily
MKTPPGSAPCSPIRAVVFDLGGVFFPWPSPDYFARWAGRLDVAPDRLHRLLWYGPDIEAANIGAITAEEYCRRCGERLNREDVHVRALIEGAFSGESLNHELAAYARALRSRVRIAALTNTWSFGRALIHRRGIGDLFDVLVTSAEVGVTKPDARIYQITLERLAVTQAEMLFVDDSEENVAAARALGIRSIRFRSTAQAIAELEALPPFGDIYA